MRPRRFPRIKKHPQVWSILLLTGFLGILMLLWFASQRLPGLDAAGRTGMTASAPKSDSPQVVSFADIDFAKKKLLFHQLGAILAEKAKIDATRPEVRESAEQIYSEETSRAEAYAQLLRAWEEPYFNITDFPETKGCHGYPTFTGMLPYADVGEYRLSYGTGVDDAYFSLLLTHHSGSEELSRIEGVKITNKKLIQLNQEVRKGYTAEARRLTDEQSEYQEISAR